MMKYGVWEYRNTQHLLLNLLRNLGSDRFC